MPKEMQPEKQKETQWFVMRDLTRPNALNPAWTRMKEEGFEVFTPLTWRMSRKGGRSVKCRVPVIHDLLFIRSTREELDPKVERIPTLQYRYAKGGGYCQPMVVAEREMENFILAVGQNDDPKFYAPSEVSESMIGRKVRIMGGALRGFEGNLLSVKGMRKKRLIVELAGMLTAAVEIQKEYIEFI